MSRGECVDPEGSPRAKAWAHEHFGSQREKDGPTETLNGCGQQCRKGCVLLRALKKHSRENIRYRKHMWERERDKQR